MKTPNVDFNLSRTGHQAALHRYRLGCLLGLVLMPSGILLDAWLYPARTGLFCVLRLGCAALLGCLWGLLRTSWGRQNYRWLGLAGIVLLLFSIGGMVYLTEGARSPYYTGLGLVLLGGGLLLRWDLAETMGVTLLALGLYSTACWASSFTIPSGLFFHNACLIAGTGLFLMIGDYFSGRRRSGKEATPLAPNAHSPRGEPIAEPEFLQQETALTAPGAGLEPADESAPNPAQPLQPGAPSVGAVTPDLIPTHPEAGLAKVLIADDEPETLTYLRMQLSGSFHVLEAVDGQQVLDQTRQFSPDIILCDLRMPEKDGLEVCRELRAQPATQSIPFVLLTAWADEGTKLAALSAGASDFLTKPFSTAELHVRLKNLVASHRFERQLARQNQLLERTLTRLKATEAQLVQSEKMASLGRWSAGIIHEINNPLNSVKTGLFYLRSKLQAAPPDQKAQFEEILKDVEEGIERVRTVVTDLRGFTHPHTGPFEAAGVEAMVDAALRFLSHEWKDKVRIDRRIPRGQTIWGNPNQLIQVLVNLLQNALDALRPKEFGPETPTIGIEGRREGPRSQLIIRDNGVGIAPENLGKIFDPFFTTKDVGAGMGLGLSICYRIIQAHGGTISVKSELGKSCEFVLEFPAKV